MREKAMRKKEEGRERIALRERLCRGLDIPPDCFSGTGLLEVRGQNSMTVKGCGKILTYTPEVIRIAWKRGVLGVYGKRLCCTSYYVGAIGIDGMIEKICFEEE